MTRLSTWLILLALLVFGLAACQATTIPQYELTISSTTGGSVTNPREGTQSYDAGTAVNLVAVADECYRFVEWTGDAVAEPSSAVTAITMNAAKNVTATFELISYGLTVDSTEGGAVVAPGEGTFSYDCADIVPLLAEADEGWYFAGWTGDLDTIADVDAAQTTITMNGAYSITASFTDTPTVGYSLTVSSASGGSVVEPGEGTFPYDAGSVVNLVVEADEGYRFVKWTGDVGTIANVNAGSTTIMMNDDYSITASFEEGVPVLFACPNLEAALREAIGIPVRDLYPSDLQGLTSFSATEADIADLTGLEYCINLRTLDLSSNRVIDISPLANLTEVEELHLGSNQIRDVSSLDDLTRLTELSLDDNEVANVSPLLENEGLGEGDVIYLRGNPLSWKSVKAYIPELRAAGVTVVYDEEGVPGEVIVNPPCEGMVAEYTITFDITADLHSGVHSITIWFPEATNVPQTGWQNGDITVNAHDVFALEVVAVGTKVVFLVPRYVPSGEVTVVFHEEAGIVNPPDGWYYYYVNTSRAPDSTPRRIGPY